MSIQFRQRTVRFRQKCWRNTFICNIIKRNIAYVIWKKLREEHYFIN